MRFPWFGLLLTLGCNAPTAPTAPTAPMVCSGSLALTPTAACAGKCDGFGADERVDLYDSDASVSCAANATATVMRRERIVSDPVLGTVMVSPSEAAQPRLCAGQPFRDQPSAGFASAVWVGKDIIVGAGHSFVDAPCDKIAVVFDYAYEAAPITPSSVPTLVPADVYTCKEVLHLDANPRGLDLAIVRLDRPVEGRVPAAVASDDVVVGQRLLMIGSPYGLPLKASVGAVQARWATPDGVGQPGIEQIGAPGMFPHDADSAKGDSGAPLFDIDTGRLQGINVFSSVSSETIAGPDPAQSCVVWAFCGVNTTCPNYNGATSTAPFAAMIAAFVDGT